MLLSIVIASFVVVVVFVVVVDFFVYGGFCRCCFSTSDKTFVLLRMGEEVAMAAAGWLCDIKSWL